MSVRPILHCDVSLRPYKLQTVHSLGNREKEEHLQFRHHFQGILTEIPDLPDKILISDEAVLHLHDTVSEQNFRYSSSANPHELHQRPLYDPKVTFSVLFGPEIHWTLLL
jgi:hypothetical protein